MDKFTINCCKFFDFVSKPKHTNNFTSLNKNREEKVIFFFNEVIENNTNET